MNNNVLTLGINGYVGVFGNYTPMNYRYFCYVKGCFDSDDMYKISIFLEEKIREFEQK